VRVVQGLEVLTEPLELNSTQKALAGQWHHRSSHRWLNHLAFFKSYKVMIGDTRDPPQLAIVIN
jgi:hypothetical protein